MGAACSGRSSELIAVIFCTEEESAMCRCHCCVFPELESNSSTLFWCPINQLSDGILCISHTRFSNPFLILWSSRIFLVSNKGRMSSTRLDSLRPAGVLRPVKFPNEKKTCEMRLIHESDRAIWSSVRELCRRERQAL